MKDGSGNSKWMTLKINRPLPPSQTTQRIFLEVKTPTGVPNQRKKQHWGDQPLSGLGWGGVTTTPSCGQGWSAQMDYHATHLRQRFKKGRDCLGGIQCKLPPWEEKGVCAG